MKKATKKQPKKRERWNAEGIDAFLSSTINLRSKEFRTLPLKYHRAVSLVMCDNSILILGMLKPHGCQRSFSCCRSKLKMFNFCSWTNWWNFFHKVTEEAPWGVKFNSRDVTIRLFYIHKIPPLHREPGYCLKNGIGNGIKALKLPLC